MTSHPQQHAAQQRSPMLRWLLQRDANAITCQLDVRNDGCYEVCVVPHWDPSSAVIERFDAPARAFLCHAEIAHRLREIGWMVIDHVATDRVQAAA